jgi:TolA-binding protein
VPEPVPEPVPVPEPEPEPTNESNAEPWDAESWLPGLDDDVPEATPVEAQVQEVDDAAAPEPWEDPARAAGADAYARSEAQQHTWEESATETPEWDARAERQGDRDRSVRSRLSEAEDLLRALDEQPRDYGAQPAAPSPAMPPEDDWTAGAAEEPPAVSPVAVPGALPLASRHDSYTDEYDYPDITRTQHHSRRVYRNRGRKLIRRLAILAILPILAAIAYLVYEEYFAHRVRTPEQLLSASTTMMDKGAYADAAKQLLLFSTHYPDDARTPEALFDAAVAVHMSPAASRDAQTARNRRALEIFQQFLSRNPNHMKARRAQHLAGLIQFELGEYEEAIATLRPLTAAAGRGLDPLVTVPALRTLARAYVQLGEAETAIDLYQAVASMPRNYTPEIDHFELGRLLVEMADKAGSPEEKRALKERASRYWLEAISTSGIDPAERERVRAMRDLLLEELLATGTPGSTVGLEGPHVPLTQPTIATPPATSGGEAVDAVDNGVETVVMAPPAEGMNAEPDPEAEARQMLDSNAAQAQ